jgi:hypothetical protein
MSKEMPEIIRKNRAISVFKISKEKAAFDLKRLESIIDTICASIPSMWETHKYRNEIAETLKMRMANEVIYG